MILVISNARDVTADFLEERLGGAGVPFARLNTEDLARIPVSFDPERTPSPSFVLNGQRIALDEVDAVYYRRPVPPEFSAALPAGTREWMENETRRAWGGVLASRPGVLWVNHPLAVSSASYKPEQLARAVRFGLLVPPTVVTTEPDVATAFCETHDWEVVVKPVGHGEILGQDEADDRIVYTNLLQRGDSARMRNVAACPTLFQRAIPKSVDLRVTVAGAELIAVALHSQDRPSSRVDCRRENMAGMRYSIAHLPAALEAKILALVRSYDLAFAALDFIVDPSGEYWFLEINAAGQWAWLEQIADAPISSAIIRCLTRSQ